MESFVRRIAPPAPPQSIAQNLYLAEATRLQLEQEVLFSPARGAGDFLLLSPAQGQLSVLFEELPAVCSAGQGLLLLPETVATLRAEEPCMLDCLTLRGALAETLLRETAQNGLFFPHAAALTDVVADLLHADEMDAPQSGKSAAAAAFSLLMQLHGSSTAPGSSAYPALVATAIGIMREEFSYLYGIEELSDRLNVTKNHLIRVFTASVGVSPGKYLTSLRIAYAKLILRSGETSLDAIAAAAGFSGADYFGKVFRRETGSTPRHYAAANPPENAPDTAALYV